jgi:quinol monooxygenase YgiN
MAYIRYYCMTAREGEEEALRSALEALSDKVRPISGCGGTELLEDADKPGRYVFLERWTSADAHKEGGKLLGKGAFAPIMATLAGPPESASLTPLG